MNFRKRQQPPFKIISETLVEWIPAWKYVYQPGKMTNEKNKNDTAAPEPTATTQKQEHQQHKL